MKKKYWAAGAGLGALGGLIAWKMLLRADETVWDEVKNEVAHADNSHFVETDGIRIHFQEFGDKNDPTMLLIHGYGASVYTWKTAAPLLAEKGFHVIALDLVGFGYSAKPAWFEYSIQSQARIISRFMNRLGIGRAIIVGSSYGGAVASTFTLDYPERVEKLVLVDAVCNDDPKEIPVLRLAALPGLGEVLSAFLAPSQIFTRRRMRETIWSENHHLVNDERVQAVTRPMRAADAHNSMLMTARNWNACRIENDAQYINHQTLIIWGEYDNVIPIRNGERLHDSILNSRFIIFKNCGHVPQEEYPEGFVQVVADFCYDKKGNVDLHEDVRLEAR